MLKKLFSRITNKLRGRSVAQVIPRAQHSVSRAGMSPAVLKVLNQLHRSGYQAYLVGGAVRDLLLGMHPKDFDVVTNAHPEEVCQLFKRCRIIGRRFRLVHVTFGREIIEVATFRCSNDTHRTTEEGFILQDNQYGRTLEEDVWRRDFTINALYYNIADFSVIDHVGGLEDLHARSIRIMGDPEQRYREDPVRMLRALRFAAKLEFALDPKTEKPLFALKHLLQHVPPARLFEEYLKLFLSGAALTCFRLLRQHDFLGIFFPALAEALISEQGPWVERFVHHALQDTDARLVDDRPVSPVFLIAVFLWPKVKQENIDIVLDLQQQHLSIPKRLLQMAVEIWRMQSRLAHIVPKHTARLLTHPRFRAAYDFFCLRARSGEEVALTPVAAWWTQYVEGSEENRLALLVQLPHPVGTKPKKRSRRRFYKLK